MNSALTGSIDWLNRLQWLT